MINARAVGSGRLKLLFIPTALSTWTFRVALGCKREKKSLPCTYVLSCVEVRGRRGQSLSSTVPSFKIFPKPKLLCSHQRITIQMIQKAVVFIALLRLSIAQSCFI